MLAFFLPFVAVMKTILASAVTSIGPIVCGGLSRSDRAGVSVIAINLLLLSTVLTVPSRRCSNVFACVGALESRMQLIRQIPKLVLWPGADEKVFFPRPRDNDYLERLGIAAESVVLCYTGNVHSANAREVRSLYLAAAILDREGTPTTLVRTGRDFCPFLGPDEAWAREGRHTESGRYRAEDWLRIYADHLEGHARQIENNVALWQAAQRR